MLTSLYSAASGMEAGMYRHEVASRNLAHLQHPGFRRVIVRQHDFQTSFSEQTQSASGDEESPEGLQIITDFTPGAIEATGNKLDVAISGKGFFTVQGPHGPLYTRNGVFQLNAEGVLVNGDGLPIEGDGGPITVPPHVPLNDLHISADGKLSVGRLKLGKLAIVDFSDTSKLESAGVSLFSAPPEIEAEPIDAVVRQGARERANVHAVDELVSIISASRHYEAAQKALQAVTSAVERHTNLQGGQ